MKKNSKSALLKLLNGIGVIILLGGIFTGWYDFGIGLVAAIAVWIIAGAIAIYVGVKDKK
jgi:hypothetical protein